MRMLRAPFHLCAVSNGQTRFGGGSEKGQLDGTAKLLRAQCSALALAYRAREPARERESGQAENTDAFSVGESSEPIGGNSTNERYRTSSNGGEKNADRICVRLCPTEGTSS